jgi:Tfp pilus assembly protein PilX
MQNFKFNNSAVCPIGKQGGFALLLGLILILIMTVFGVYAMNGSILQERMAGSQREQKTAFEASEMTLRWGEAWIQSRTPVLRPFPCQTLVSDANQNCSDPRQVLSANLLSYNLAQLDPWGKNDDWSNARDFGIDPLTNKAFDPPYQYPGVTRPPKFVMEQQFIDRDDLAGNPQQGRVFYRVIAAANGARQSTLSVLESHIAKRYE